MATIAAQAGQIDQERGNDGAQPDAERDQALLEAEYAGKDVIRGQPGHQGEQADIDERVA